MDDFYGTGWGCGIILGIVLLIVVLWTNCVHKNERFDCTEKGKIVEIQPKGGLSSGFVVKSDKGTYTTTSGSPKLGDEMCFRHGWVKE